MSTSDLFAPPTSGPAHILEDLAGVNSPSEMAGYFRSRARQQEAHARRQRQLAHRRMLHEATRHPRDRKPTHADQRSQRKNPLYSRAMDATRQNDGAIGKTQQGIPSNSPLTNILSATPYFGSGGTTP